MIHEILCQMPNNNHFVRTLSRAILATTGVLCFAEIYDTNLLLPRISYGLIVVNNFVGVLWWATRYDSRFYDIFKFTSYCQLLFVLPSITSQVWLQNGYAKEWSWAFVSASCFQFLCYAIDADLGVPLVEPIILCSFIALGLASWVNEIRMGVAAAVTYGVAHCFVRHVTLYNYILCFFSYFALRAMGFGEEIFME